MAPGSSQGEGLAVSIEYTCQVCRGVVVQLVDERGLPERTTCPWCAEETARAVERFREREQRQLARERGHE
jgi:hypothetical protein